MICHTKPLRILPLLAVIAAVISAETTRAEDLYVAASARSNGNGTAANPYWRITDAVARARADRRAGVAEPITIHVAPGTYVGSYSNSSNKQIETLPIVLNISNLTLCGATVLAKDAQGIPTGVAPGSLETTLLTYDVFGSYSQTLIAILRTTDGGAGDNVTITGLTIDQPNHANDTGQFSTLLASGSNVVAEHVSGFAIVGNVMRHGGTDSLSRLASGIMEGNILTASGGPGAFAGGGTSAYPSRVTMRANRVTGNVEHGMMVCVGLPKWNLDLGHNDLTPLPLQVSGNHAENTIVGLGVTILGNDFSQNGAIGLRCLFVPPYLGSGSLPEELPGVPLLTATVSGNTMSGNGRYGFDVEGGDLYPIPNTWFSGTFVGSFSGNQIQGNGLNGALFTFTSPGGGATYLQQAIYQVTDLDGEIAAAGFDYNNPGTDSTGTVLNDTIVIDGTVVPPGIKITPSP